jgi:hypothetical protein
MIPCDLCGSLIKQELHSAFYAMCEICAREVFLRSPRYREDSGNSATERGWKTNLDMRIKYRGGLRYNKDQGFEFSVVIEQLKTQFGACPQCGYIHTLMATPYPS